LARLKVDGLAELNENRFVVTRALDWRSEEAPSAVRNGWLHGLTDDLRDEHTWPQALARADFNPLEAVVLDVLRIAEGAGGDPE
jgi:hypothetical protein